MNFEDYETLPTNNVVTHMSAGAIAGIMEHCVMYPLDSVKTRMQSLAPGTLREGINDTFLRMVKHEGILRPVRGMSAMVVGAGPSHALYFSSYEYLKDAMIQKTTTSRYHTLIYVAVATNATSHHAKKNIILEESYVVLLNLMVARSQLAASGIRRENLDPSELSMKVAQFIKNSYSILIGREIRRHTSCKRAMKLAYICVCYGDNQWEALLLVRLAKQHLKTGQ